MDKKKFEPKTADQINREQGVIPIVVEAGTSDKIKKLCEKCELFDGKHHGEECDECYEDLIAQCLIEEGIKNIICNYCYWRVPCKEGYWKGDCKIARKAPRKIMRQLAKKVANLGKRCKAYVPEEVK